MVSILNDKIGFFGVLLRIPVVLYFGPKKFLKESTITCGVASKRQVWSTFFLFEIFDHVSKGKFGPDSNCSKRQVCSRFGEKLTVSRFQSGKKRRITLRPCMNLSF